MRCSRIFSALGRCKQIDTNDDATPLKRCLSLLDLTALGTGSTLGLGVYVLAGAVAKDVAGPAVTISFLVAAVASALSALSYAEFAARVPKAGSAYVYSYVSVGEFIAFTIGWNLILEYVIGTAGIAKGMALYIDSLFNNTMERRMIEIAPIHVSFLDDYPDFLALGLVVVVTALLSIGVQESTKLNNVFTGLNLITVVIVVVAGAIYSYPANWKIHQADIPEQYKATAGTGGFAPFGVAGIMAGAAKCFFGFIGFDVVATTGEEAKNPKRDIPLAIMLSLLIVFLSYFSISTVLTMMLPYYMQDEEAPFPHAFTMVGLTTIKWIVTIGAIFALCTSLLTAIYALPRVIYAMATDGLLFRPLAAINSKTKTPLTATVLSGAMAGILTTIFNLNQLIDLMSIGTLLAYIIVAISVLVMRYKNIKPVTREVVVDTKLRARKSNLLCSKYPTKLTFIMAKIVMALSLIMAIAACALLRWEQSAVALGVLGALLLASLVVLYLQPMNDVENLTFSVPWVPLVPYISVCINVYLMLQLDYQTWIRFVVWVIIGYIIYFFYGIKHSTVVEQPEEEVSEAGQEDKISGIVMISSHIG
ncbi:cationic amino acid transporter 3-like [Anticarsia gemmatalis]|uniref:cationic amino acid transporter 3-like n=1 Tax=Anticarsia gemmatalis TaxID=129554 RepID=UPI003F7604A0